MNGVLAIAAILVRAEEAWEPVLFGGLIPILGAAGVFFLIWYAVRKSPEKGQSEEDES